MRTTAMLCGCCSLLLGAGIATAHPALLTAPFDFSRHEIGLNVTVDGKRLTMLLDTGVNPSAIDEARAKQLGLPLDVKRAGQGSGEGGGQTQAIPTTIRGLSIGGRDFGSAEALASDLRGMSAAYGRKLDGVLGYSFLKSKTVLIDYPARAVTFFASAADSGLAERQCRRRYEMPFTSLGDAQFPLIRDFRFGKVRAPVTLDTGSSRTVGLYRAALQYGEIRRALKLEGAEKGASFGGAYSTRNAILNLRVSIGPFEAAAGLRVSVMPGEGSATARIANIGNRLLDALKLKLLLDYAHKRIAFFGDCGK